MDQGVLGLSRWRFPALAVVLVSIVTVLGVVVAPSTAARAGGPGSGPAPSLPTVTSGHPPGPDALYAPEPLSPILANHDPRFRAAPLLVCGQEGYVDGEYLYQDHIYDDYGADTDYSGNSSLSSRYGNIDPPTDRARYGGNGADLVELRIVPSASEVSYRITYNTLLAADAPIAAIAYDTDLNKATGRSTLVPDPGSPVPGTDEVITVWGTGGQHARLLTDGATVVNPIAVTTDLASHQVTFSVPRSISDPPASGAWRMTWMTGIHDGHHGWAQPVQTATATQPGGTNGRAGVSSILNVGPRFAEPYVGKDTPPDTAQAAALRDGDLSAFGTTISWGELAAHKNHNTVPTSGTTVRIFPSAMKVGDGRNLGSALSSTSGPQYLGQLQAYSLYVPSSVTDGQAHPFTLALHSLSDHHWQYNGTTGILQIGEQRGSLVATPMARGQGMWYLNEGEVDVFEVWADVARHFRLDPDRTAISGYSMGGYATYRLGGLYPDLFGKAFSTVGPPGDGIWVPPLAPTGGPDTLTNRWLENNLNLPYLNLVATEDELVPIRGTTAQNMGDAATGVIGFDQLGYRFRFRVYDPAEHLTLAVLSYNVKDAVAFLGDARVDRDPVHVTYSHLPATDVPALGLLHDHAYWMSDIAVAPGVAKGTVDAFSHGRGLGDPTSTATAPAAGVDPIPYTELGRTWGAPPPIPVQNQLDLKLTGVASTTVDLARAAIDPSREITVSSDTDRPGTVLLGGPIRAATVTGALGYRIVAGGIAVDLAAGHSDIVINPRNAPPVVPEAPLTVLIPLSMAAAFVVLVLRGQRRRRAV